MAPAGIVSAPMHVELGPLPSASALTWVDYARAVLSAGHALVDEAMVDLPPDVRSAFDGYLNDWRAAAREDEVFTWSADVPAEWAEYLLLAFYRLAQRLSKAAEARGVELAPPEGRAFYLELVNRLLDALAQSGESGAEFADHLRSFWPGIEEVG
jgi:hypothetical protein